MKQKLDGKGIRYVTVNDVDAMTEKGIETVPVLEVDGQMMSFKEAVDWINGR